MLIGLTLKETKSHEIHREIKSIAFQLSNALPKPTLFTLECEG